MSSNRSRREQLQRFSRLTEAQAALGWGIILILAALLGTIYLRQTSNIATVGRRVQFLQADLDQLKRENSLLERQIAETQSIERLQREAIQLGFIPAGPANIEYLIVPEYPVTALMPPPPAPQITEMDPPQSMKEAIWLAIRSGINNLVRGEAYE
jgi:cell division protein FtsL